MGRNSRLAVDEGWGGSKNANYKGRVTWIRYIFGTWLVDVEGTEYTAGKGKTYKECRPGTQSTRES